MNAKTNESGSQQALKPSAQSGAAPSAQSGSPAKSTKPEVSQKQPADFPLTLDEFCKRASTQDKRVELIGAFHFAEKSAARVKDTEANYKKRFDEFVRRPVKD